MSKRGSGIIIWIFCKIIGEEVCGRGCGRYFVEGDVEEVCGRGCGRYFVEGNVEKMSKKTKN